MKIYFYETSELNVSSYVKYPLRLSVMLNIEFDDNYCFFLSTLAHLRPIAVSKNGHRTKVSKNILMN